jgi:transposase
MGSASHRRTGKVSAHRLERICGTAAGIDAGSREHWVAVDPDLSPDPIRCFGTYTADLVALADWLQSVGVTTVAIESTGVYWVGVAAVLESHGIEVCVTDARATKQVAGRKSDVSDCQWIQQLHSYGLLKPAVVLGADQSALRSYLRQRERWIRDAARSTQHMQQALELMNLKLTEVLSDVTGKTGRAIIDAILAGERDPQVLAQHRDPRCKRPVEEIARALHGCWQADQLFALEQAVLTYDFLQARVADCDRRIDTLLTALHPPDEGPQPPDPQRASKTTSLGFDAHGHCFRLAGGVDLTTINGVGCQTALIVLSEIGGDVSRWPTARAFCAWLGLAPNNRRSAGRISGSRHKPGNRRASQALMMAAESLLRASCALGAYLRRLRARLGPARAIKATARKIAGIIHTMLATKVPYHDVGQAAYDERFAERRRRSISRMAKELGCCLVPIEANGTA